MQTQTDAHAASLSLGSLLRSPLLPPTATTGRMYSLLSFHAYISNTSWCGKLVKNPSPWKCHTPWGKHDGSGSAGPNIPRAPFISHSTSVYLFFHTPRVAIIFAQKTKPALSLLTSVLSWLTNP